MPEDEVAVGRCRNCGKPLAGLVRGTGRVLGVVPKGFCAAGCAAANAAGRAQDALREPLLHADHTREAKPV